MKWLIILFLFIGNIVLLDTTLTYRQKYRSCDLSYRQAETYQLCYPNNLKELRKNKTQADIVLIGDSITEMFPAQEIRNINPSFINLGISGNTTLEMLDRFNEVLKYKPKTVVIFGGVCDFAQGVNICDITHHLTAMVEIAQANGIKPYLCTLLPTFKEENRSYYEKELELNEWIRGQFDYIDYFSALSDGTYMDKRYSVDGTHPTYAGFVKMAELLKKTLEEK
jgi:lysophospholipase L1-like esterase